MALPRHISIGTTAARQRGYEYHYKLTVRYVRLMIYEP